MTSTQIAEKLAEARQQLAELTPAQRAMAAGRQRLTNLRNRIKRLSRTKPLTPDRAAVAFEKAVVKMRRQMSARGFEEIVSTIQARADVITDALVALKLPCNTRQIASPKTGDPIVFVFSTLDGCHVYAAVEHAWPIINAHRTIPIAFSSAVRLIAKLPGLVEEFHTAYRLDADPDMLWAILKPATQIDPVLEDIRERVRG